MQSGPQPLVIDGSNGTGVQYPPLRARYLDVRRFTEHLCEPLATEDYVIQTMEDVSPTKWHIAHTSWFFETFILKPHLPDYQPFHPAFGYLFNSYYMQAGERFSRPHRGLLSRPTVQEVFAYRHHVDAHVTQLLDDLSGSREAVINPLVEIGLQHEQQHQELMLTDIKHVFSFNPLRPIYRNQPDTEPASAAPRRWIGFEEDVYFIGHEGDGFHFDNEAPRHRQFVHAFSLGSRPVTCGEYLAFMEAGGYDQPTLWLSEGWIAIDAGGWNAPLYWENRDGQWWQMTLSGMQPVDENQPVCHVSYFEADAYARWAGARLPTEAEWEVASRESRIDGNFAENSHYHPVAPPAQAGNETPAQLFGDVWEWTQSAYAPYHGYKPAEGALGEYNGKFMCNQMVLRGGSCATSRSHIRRTYRNFFPPSARWQFSGIRLARDV